MRAAAHLFQTRGINATTIQDMTHAASIAKGAFYNYFQSKEQLILELAAQTPGTRDDIEAIDLLIDELQQPRPRTFLVDALLSHLASRDHLTTALKPTITSWNTWKGTPQ